MKTHNLKTWPQYFYLVNNGLKPFEIRLNDRNFVEGDLLWLWEYCPDREKFTGRRVKVQVTCIIDFMQRDDWVVMGIKKLDMHLWHSYGPWLWASVGKEARYCKFCGVPQIRYVGEEPL